MTEVIANHVFQSLTQRLLAELPVAYLSHINKPHDLILQEQRNRTGQGEYLVGNMLFNNNRMGRMHTVQQLPGHRMQPLDPSLRDAHRDWYKLYSQHRSEWRTACQMISSVMMRVQTWQDFRDCLPDHVSRPILSEPELVGLTRMRPEIYAGPPATTPNYDAERQIREDLWGPRPVSMYNQVAPLVDLYVGYSLL